ncbi:hypothetical protein AURDEDRAFT_160920 [Auricularia subglabra TFB-10046 SS5]|nr:hypothetical protein AURDEDRAFT_160920 [Auricularia subglabra TFB-10046 SS5]
MQRLRSTPGTAFAEDIAYIPPEIRAHIACYCTVRSLGRLCRADRLWAAEAEPYLYRRVRLLFSGNLNETRLSCVDALCKAPQKLARIHTLLLEIDGDSLYPEDPNLPDAIARFLLSLDNIDDLRVRGQNEMFQRMVLSAAAQQGVRFRLRTLYLLHMEDDMEDHRRRRSPTFFVALKVHGPTLRRVGIEPRSGDGLQSTATAFHGRYGQLIHPDYALFSYVRTDSTFAVAVYNPTPAKIAAAAQSLDDDPSPRIADAAVNALEIDYTDERWDAFVPNYVSHFPRVVRLWATVPTADDARTLAAAVSSFPRLSRLQISTPGQDRPHRALSWPARQSLADCLTSRGCAMLREIKFTDWTVARRDVRLDGTPVGEWFVPDKGRQVLHDLRPPVRRDFQFVV